jgi:hypothetical protein
MFMLENASHLLREWKEKGLKTIGYQSGLSLDFYISQYDFNGTFYDFFFRKFLEYDFTAE